jgi:hypothetical protein
MRARRQGSQGILVPLIVYIGIGKIVLPLGRECFRVRRKF